MIPGGNDLTSLNMPGRFSDMRCPACAAIMSPSPIGNQDPNGPFAFHKCPRCNFQARTNEIKMFTTSLNILGLKEGATEDEVEDAYTERKKRYSKDPKKLVKIERAYGNVMKFFEIAWIWRDKNLIRAYFKLGVKPGDPIGKIHDGYAKNLQYYDSKNPSSPFHYSQLMRAYTYVL